MAEKYVEYCLNSIEGKVKTIAQAMKLLIMFSFSIYGLKAFI